MQRPDVLLEVQPGRGRTKESCISSDWNTGSISNLVEVVDVRMNRTEDISCVQETRW